MNISNFMNSSLTKLLPPKSQSWSGILAETHVQKAISLSILGGF